MEIDLIVLTRDASPLRDDVRRGIELQADVSLVVHRVIGARRPGDSNRWETIARARNEGRRRGSSPWVMYLDDDVVLGRGCVSALAEGLRKRSLFAALAADSFGEMSPGAANWDYPVHVRMAATMFRRERLARLQFRWEPGKCECQCCCDDLRDAGFAIGYLRGASARHLPSRGSPAHGHTAPAVGRPSGPAAPGAQGRVLAAFNRPHARKFERQFLATLRASGNREPVTAVAYGLLPEERSALAGRQGVEVVERHDNGIFVAVRRLEDFQPVIAGWPADTPVAYWDAGDVLFQGSLEPLWDLVRAKPDRLLAAREPLTNTQSGALAGWTRTVHDRDAARFVYERLFPRPVFNSGFAAGTVRTMLRYLKEAHRLRHSRYLEGTTGGDQLAMNLYFSFHPDSYLEVPEGWNYCLCKRPQATYAIGQDGKFRSLAGTPVIAVHGNAGRLPRSVLARLDPGRYGDPAGQAPAHRPASLA